MITVRMQHHMVDETTHQLPRFSRVLVSKGVYETGNLETIEFTQVGMQARRWLSRYGGLELQG